MKKEQQNYVDGIPLHFRRSCSCMSADGGFRDWLDAKYGVGKWALAAYAKGEVEVALDNHTYGDLAVEYGHQKLTEHFAPIVSELTGALQEMLEQHGGLLVGPAAKRAQAAIAQARGEKP